MANTFFYDSGNDFTLLVGGQVVSGLTNDDFKALFTARTLNGNLNATISKVFGINESKIPKKENVSLIDIYELIGDEVLKLYLSREFGFYLSQGCKHSCSFCAADRTIVFDKKTQKKVAEQYRDINIALADFEYLIKKAAYYNISQVRIYLSNLDLFQTPLLLFSFAEGIIKIKEKYVSVDIKLRGLSTSQSFLKAHRDFSQVIKSMIKAGLEQIGFGIDGATPQVYRQTRKPQSVQDSLDTVNICRNIYGITPETLMVFGHNNIEDENALMLAVKFCKDMQKKYGAIPRPHIAKDMVPGNDGWTDPKNDLIKREFYKNPMLFQNLDFTAIPSPVTHPDSEFRDIVTKYYKMVCELPNSLTKLVLAEYPTMTEAELAFVHLYNNERYDI